MATDTDERTATPALSDGEINTVAVVNEKNDEINSRTDKNVDAKTVGATPDEPADIVLAPATTHGSNAEPHYVTGVKLWLVILALSLALFVTMLDMSIVSTAIPRITNQFHSLNDVGWYGAAYQLAW